MKANEQTYTQIERAIKKIAAKYPQEDEPSIMTDIHLRVSQDSGEMVAFNDDEKEINRCVIDEWINDNDEHFYDGVATIIRKVIGSMKETVDHLGILKPYGLVLENDEKETITELYVVDDDTVIIDSDLMEGLDKDLDDFLTKLLKK